MRKQQGMDALAKIAISQMRLGKQRYVVDGIKNPAEARALRREADSFLLAVQAATETRYVRMKSGLKHDRAAFDAIDRTDNVETDRWGIPILHGQRVADCIAIADGMLWNDAPLLATPGPQKGDLAELAAKVYRFAMMLEEPGSEPPSTNEIRMCQAYVVARQSSCLQRKVGAVITNRHERIIAEGHNEVPERQSTCMELHGECYRKRLRRQELEALSEMFLCAKCGGGSLDADLHCTQCRARYEKLLPKRPHLDYCRALHAEENAILQVSKHGGMGVVGGTIYATTFPCGLCAKKIVECGIEKVIFSEPYKVEEAEGFFKAAGIEVHCFEGSSQRAFQRVFNPD